MYIVVLGQVMEVLGGDREVCTNSLVMGGDKNPVQHGECEAITEHTPWWEDDYIWGGLLAEFIRVQMQHGIRVKDKNQVNFKTWRNWSRSKLLR